MSVEIEPLLQKLSGFAPLFGRAKDDIEAMVSRGRAGDYKGVMQNARLVLEALLRSLVTEELKQTPGKAMLDELVTKFRQQANAGLIPTNVLAHMGTVQAWGNLSAHDHAGSLTDQGVQVGLEEVVASLNSMVAILTWYAAKKGLTPTAAVPLPKLPDPIPRPKPSGLSNATLLATSVAAALGVAAVVALKSTLMPPKESAATPFAALDALYAAWKEPVPPVGCRDGTQAAQLAKNATNIDALSLIEKPSPEAAYLLARATFEGRKQKSPALSAALACNGFAAAEYLAGVIAIDEQHLDDARAHLEKAAAAAPTFLDARSKHAAVLIEQDQLDEGLAEADALILAAPDYHPGFLVRGAARAKKGDTAGATADICKAARLGSTQARAKVEQLKLTCT